MDNEVDLDKEIGTNRLLIICCSDSGELTLEENPFPAWQLVGIAAWLEMLGQEELMEPQDAEDD